METPLTRPSLLRQIRDAEDHLAWSEFVEIYTPLLYGYCRRQGLQDADAADVSQEIMRAVAQAIRTFQYDPERGTFRSWLFKAVRRRVGRFYRQQQKRLEIQGDTRLQHALETQAKNSEQMDWDRDYRQRLFQWASDKVQKEVQETTWRAFWMTLMEDQPGAKVAQELNMSVGAVYIAKSRIMARLKEKIASIVAEEEVLLPPN